MNKDGIAIGDMNDVELVLGNRGQGKSTYCADRALELQTATGGYVIGHSLGNRFPSKLPDGTVLDVEYYPTVERLDIGLRRHPNRMHILVGGNGDEIIDYARRLSARIRKAAYYREHGRLRGIWAPWSNLRSMSGIIARPVIVIIDEGVAMNMNLGKTSAKNADNKKWREALYSARHEHIAYLLQCQDINALGAAAQTQATHYIVFRSNHQWMLNGVQAAGATPEMIEEIRNLERFEYVEFGPAVSEPTSEVKPNPSNQPKEEKTSAK